MAFLTELLGSKQKLPHPDKTLPGREAPIATTERHYVNGRLLKEPYPEGLQTIHFGMGCFWGAERLFWNIDGVWVTAVGYAGGATPNPTYQETCTGLTGHAEIVRVVFDPERVPLEDLLAIFWENHDPTQGMRQGNDIGTTYRSAIYTGNDRHYAAAIASRESYAKALLAAGRGAITTEIAPLRQFYFAEEEHQQYLAKVPHGYCGLAGTGICFPDGMAAGAESRPAR